MSRRTVSRSQVILVGGPATLAALRRKYIAALIDVLSAMGSRCQADPELAERIARLLRKAEELQKAGEAGAA